MTSTSGALLFAALLAGAADAAEPPPVARCSATSRVDLAADSSDVAPDVCVTADEPTTFFFDSRVTPGAVEFQPEGRLVDWSQGKEGLTITVVPREDYLSGERVRVMVRFADGILPASASFWLVGHADRGTRRVEVYRQPRPADAFKREAADAQAEARQCREEKSQLLSERNLPGGLMGATWLQQGGASASKEISKVRAHPANALKLKGGKAYSYTPTGGAKRLACRSGCGSRIRVMPRGRLWGLPWRTRRGNVWSYLPSSPCPFSPVTSVTSL